MSLAVGEDCHLESVLIENHGGRWNHYYRFWAWNEEMHGAIKPGRKRALWVGEYQPRRAIVREA